MTPRRGLSSRAWCSEQGCQSGAGPGAGTGTQCMAGAGGSHGGSGGSGAPISGPACLAGGINDVMSLPVLFGSGGGPLPTSSQELSGGGAGGGVIAIHSATVKVYGVRRVVPQIQLCWE